jgi:two-component system cell cycle response regulator
MRILVAEDDRVTRKLLESYLKKWGHEVVACSDGQEAWSILQGEEAPRLAILDWMMPKMSGVEACRNVRDLNGNHYIYLILLTSRNGKEDVVKGLEAGADDYIVKPFDPNELKVRVRAAVRMVRLQEELSAALTASEFRASHDPLTGLWNRGAILEILKKEITRSKRQKTPLSVVMTDIDHFKQINDQFGHLVGDDVLREVTRKLSSSVRPYDSIGRYGGEEFLVVIPGCNNEEAYRLADRVRRVFSTELTSTSERDLAVTLSFGVAEAYSTLDSSADEIIRIADQALYRAKEKGRNRVEKGVPINIRSNFALERPDLENVA